MHPHKHPRGGGLLDASHQGEQSQLGLHANVSVQLFPTDTLLLSNGREIWSGAFYMSGLVSSYQQYS